MTSLSPIAPILRKIAPEPARQPRANFNDILRGYLLFGR
jgi:hypothetical protein